MRDSLYVMRSEIGFVFHHMTPSLKMRLGFPEFSIDRQAENSTKPAGILGVAVSTK